MNGLRRERHGLESQVRLLEKENQDARRHVAEWRMRVSLLAQSKKLRSRS